MYRNTHMLHSLKTKCPSFASFFVLFCFFWFSYFVFTYGYFATFCMYTMGVPGTLSGQKKAGSLGTGVMGAVNYPVCTEN